MIRCILAFLLACSFVAAQSSQPNDEAGHWEGYIRLPNQSMIIRVDLKREQASWCATNDIPQQGAYGLTLEKISVDADKMFFSIRKVAGNPTFIGICDAKSVKGEFTQGGMKVPFDLGRDKIESTKRPQDPVPPLPY